jgi:hypothetical protein
MGSYFSPKQVFIECWNNIWEEDYTYIILLHEQRNEITSSIPSFVHQWLYSPLSGPDLFFSFLIFFTQTVGLLGRWISPLQDRYLHAGQHKHRINAHTDIHAFSEIRPHDHSVRGSENGSCLTPRSYRDRLIITSPFGNDYFHSLETQAMVEVWESNVLVDTALVPLNFSLHKLILNISEIAYYRRHVLLLSYRCLWGENIVTRQRIARQRPDKHAEINACNNRTIAIARC